MSYIFREDKGDGVIIIEHNPAGVECAKDLIPHTKLDGLVPFTLVENFSHWYDRERNIIEFRPKLFSDADFGTADGFQYELDLETCHLKHKKSEQLLLDVQSSSFKTVAKRMKRLDHCEYILVWLDAPHTARIEMVRMKLNFTIDCSKARKFYYIHSKEYDDMHISAKQNVGTLFGVRFGLILESKKKNVNKQLLIVPHGKFSVKQSDHHVDVEMSEIETKLRTPPFFIYQVDNVCRTLKANSFAAWFNLAYLHAVTSYPLPDPFTGMTGVERALQILQSGYVWSSSPHDDETLSTLSALANLSPHRKFQMKQDDAPGEYHQLTKWPSEIRLHAAQDAFVLIVQKLVADSMRLQQLLMPNEKKAPLRTNTLSSLNARSHARHAPYAPNCGVLDTFLVCDNRMTHFTAEELDQSMMNVRELAAHYSSGEFHVPTSNVGNSIFELFSSEERLIGCASAEDTSVIRFCSKSSFANLWTSLYEGIRQQRLSKEHLHMIFTLLAFKGNDKQQLQILQAIAANPGKFSRCVPPNYALYEAVNCYEFDAVAIQKVIDSVKTPIDTIIERNRERICLFPAREKELRTEYDEDIKRIKNQLIHEVKRQWPCERIDKSKIRMSDSTYLNIIQACDAISDLLGSWYRNGQLLEFTVQIDEIISAELRQFSALSINQREWTVCEVGTQPFPKYSVNYDEKMSSNQSRYAPHIALARRIFFENANGESTLNQYWDQFQKMSVSISDTHLLDAQLYPRLVPTTVLPRILRPIYYEQQYLIGALAVMTCREQYAKRGANASPLHENWKPHEHPEWLLFQIETDLSIRRVQVRLFF